MLHKLKPIGLVAAGIATISIPAFFFYSNSLPIHGQNSYEPLRTIQTATHKSKPAPAIELVESQSVEASQQDDISESTPPQQTTPIDSEYRVTTSYEDSLIIELTQEASQTPEKIAPSHIELPNQNTTAELTDKPSIKVDTYEVTSGTTLISLLRKSGVSTQEINKLVFGSGIRKKTLALNVGSSVEISMLGQDFQSMKILSKGKQFTEIKKSSTGRYSEEILQHPEIQTEISSSFLITQSLSANARAKGLTDAEVAVLKSVFSEKLNLNKLSKNAIVRTLFLRKTYNENYFGDSDLVAAIIEDGDKSFSAFRWEHNNNTDYFDIDGMNLKNTFRKHPVDNVRITSQYNPKRLHPVLKITRPHRGTDYAGNRQPIKAIGDGKIYYAGRKGSFGNTVIIRHGKEVQTLSAHMYKIAKGIKKGQKVKKGQIIGYVGSTGVVTGPHLHFEMKIRGKYVNPLKANLATNEQVENKVQFFEHVKTIRNKLTS